jgi:hypothetical protein
VLRELQAVVCQAQRAEHGVQVGVVCRAGVARALGPVWGSV